MSISIKECLAFGWRTFKVRPWFFVLVMVVLFAASLVSGLLQSLITALVGKTFGGMLSFILSLVVDVFMGIGMVAVTLKAHDAVMAASLRDLWNPKLFWKYLGAYVLVFVITIIGFILLIVPGLILSVVLSFTLMLVVDRSLGPIEAMKESARLTRGHRWNLLWLFLAFVGINILGVLALLIGLLITIPVTTLALVHVYRKLSVPAA
jgi:uncharacterized membrane protein